MSDHVGNVMSESGVDENVGIAAGGTSPAIYMKKLISLPVFVVAILSFGCRPMSGNVGCVMSELGVVENMGVTVELSSVVVVQAEIACI